MGEEGGGYKGRRVGGCQDGFAGKQGVSRCRVRDIYMIYEEQAALYSRGPVLRVV